MIRPYHPLAPTASAFSLGPIGQNSFGAYGDTLANAIAARDAYFTANPAILAGYDANSLWLIQLLYTESTVNKFQFNSRAAGEWVNTFDQEVAAVDLSTHSVTELNDVTDAGSGKIITDDERDKFNRAYFAVSSTDTITITTDTVNPTTLGSVSEIKSNGISIADATTGAMVNNTGRTISLMTGTINYNPNKGGGGNTVLSIVSERSDDGGSTWVGNLESNRTIEIANSNETFGTKVSTVTDWEDGQWLRFRAWRAGGGSLVFESTSVSALGQTFTTPSMAWELVES